MATIGQIPRPSTATRTCPDVYLRRSDILLITTHDRDILGDQSIHVQVKDLDALIGMLVTARQKAEELRASREAGNR